MFSPPDCSLVTAEDAPMREGRVQVRDSISDDVLEQWRGLVATGQHAQPFYQPEWFLAFARSFAADQRVQLVTVSEGGRLAAVLPLMRKGSFFQRIPARTLSSLSGIHSCRFDLITGGEVSSSVVSAIWDTLVKDDSWDVIEVLDVPDGGSFSKVVSRARESGFLVGSWPTRKSPVLRFPPVGTDPFQNCPSSFGTFRKRLKGKLGKLRQRGEVSFRVEESAYEEGLARFLLLESSGWKGANKSAIASDSQSTGFYSSVVEFLQGRGELRLYSLCLDSKPISMHLGLMMDGIYYSPKVAYDEAFAYFSPGHLLVQHIINDLAELGAHTFEFLGPRALWKSVWTADVVEHSNWYIFRPTLTGRLLHSLTMRLAPRLRAFRHRMNGDPQDVLNSKRNSLRH